MSAAGLAGAAGAAGAGGAAIRRRRPATASSRGRGWGGRGGNPAATPSDGQVSLHLWLHLWLHLSLMPHLAPPLAYAHTWLHLSLHLWLHLSFHLSLHLWVHLSLHLWLMPTPGFCPPLASAHRSLLATPLPTARFWPPPCPPPCSTRAPLTRGAVGEAVVGGRLQARGSPQTTPRAGAFLFYFWASQRGGKPGAHLILLQDRENLARSFKRVQLGGGVLEAIQAPPSAKGKDSSERPEAGRFALGAGGEEAYAEANPLVF